jgi:hypothetical protein
MTKSTSRTFRGALLGVAVLSGVGLAACGSTTGDGSGITLPSISTTTTEASTTTTARETTTTTERSSTTSSSPPTTQAASTTTAGGGGSTTTTAAPTTTTTTAAPTTTTTTAPTTTTTRATTTTTTKETTTTTAAAGTTVAPTTTIDGANASGSTSGVSPWIWVLIAVLVLAAILVAVLAVVRGKRNGAARWNWGARDLARRSGDAARRLEQAAAGLGSPTADRQVWLEATTELDALATSAAALVPDAPKVPGDPEGTNSLATGIESLRSNLTVLRSAATEAERTRFELVGPTTEQLNFATRSVEQAAAAVVGDAHAVAAAVDRVDPPQPTAPPR